LLFCRPSYQSISFHLFQSDSRSIETNTKHWKRTERETNRKN